MILRAQPSMTKCQMRTRAATYKCGRGCCSGGVELVAVSYPAEVVDAFREADLKCLAKSLEVAASSNLRGPTIPSGTLNFRQLIGFGINNQIGVICIILPEEVLVCGLQCRAKSPSRSGRTFKHLTAVCSSSMGSSEQILPIVAVISISELLLPKTLT